VWCRLYDDALAVAGAALAAHLDFQDRFLGGLVLDDGDVTVFEALGLVGAQASVGHEQHVVVQLLVVVAVVLLLRILGAVAGCLVARCDILAFVR
jgi:hypothetical protein